MVVKTILTIKQIVNYAKTKQYYIVIGILLWSHVSVFL